MTDRDDPRDDRRDPLAPQGDGDRPEQALEDDRLEDDLLEEALLGWAAPEVPAGFADRVLAARSASAGPTEPAAPPPALEVRARPSFFRRAAVLPVLAAAAAGLLVAVVDRVELARWKGEVQVAERTRVELGARAVAVAEAGTHLVWSGSGLTGAVAVTQDAGSAFYRVRPGGSFEVTTPAGRAVVTGTCFQVEVLPMNAVAQLPRSHFLSAAAGAVLGAALVVTVYEGSVTLENERGSVSVEAGELAGVTAGQAPVSGGDLHKLRAARDQAQAERDRLRGQVDELEDQLKTFMLAQANGSDPLVAENQRLQGQLERLRRDLDVERQLRDEKEGRPFEWPEGISDSYRQEAVRSAVAESLKRSGLLGDITTVDCSEFPCMVQGETLVEGYSEESSGALDKGHREMQAVIKELYPKEKNDLSNSSWGDIKRVIDGKEYALRQFSIAVYPSDSVPKEQREDFDRRRRWRLDQIREAMPME